MQCTTKILILGGTTEANNLAIEIAKLKIPAVYSYAGRVSKPKQQPITIRTGGFGGVAGLKYYITKNNITHLIDCTHPFAQQMSTNAQIAALESGIKMLIFTRPAWVPNTSDKWRFVPDIKAAVNALPTEPQRIFLAIGRMHLSAFKAQLQHYFLLRLIDDLSTDISFPKSKIILGRGPFSFENEINLMSSHNINLVVSKNAGGQSSENKLLAARKLSIPVIMIDRPNIPATDVAHHLEDVIKWLKH